MHLYQGFLSLTVTNIAIISKNALLTMPFFQWKRIVLTNYVKGQGHIKSILVQLNSVIM